MAVPEWLTAALPFVKDKRVWEILEQRVLLALAERDNAISELNQADAALADAKEQIASLQSQVNDLKKEVERFQPIRSVPKEALQILQYLFNETRFYTARDFVEIFELELGVVNYHCENCLKGNWLTGIGAR
jgi:predicted  nucleic acid-binding Zn-ribbon protein